MFKQVLFFTLLVTAGFCDDESGKRKTTTTTEKTTTKPSTTTSKPTTEPPTEPTTETTTSTETPITPTPPPTTSIPPTIITTTSAPTPIPDIPWIVRDITTGRVCILAKADIHIDVTYKTKENKTAVGKVSIPKNATVNGSCGAEQNLKLLWDKNNMSINFVSNATTKQYWVESIDASVFVTPALFPNISDTNTTVFELKHDGKNFVTPLNSSYSCSTELQLNMNMKNNSVAARLSLNHLRLDAFHESNKTEFSAALECENDESPDIVPIAVGCAIAILIILVLITYLVSRHHSRARGYLSM